MAEAPGLALENTQTDTAPVPAPVTSTLNPVDDLDKVRVSLDEKRAEITDRQNRLMTMLEERNKPNPSEFFGAIARGFGDPNAKYFAQGAAGAAGNLNDLENTNRARELQTAQMRMQLAQSQLGLDKEDAIKNITSKLYTKDATGTLVLNPEAAQVLTRLTGNPQYVQQIIADQKKRQQGSAFNSMFVQQPDSNKIEFDKTAFKKYMSVSENPLEDAAKFADLYKKIRPLMFGSNDTSSVFDAAIMGAKDHPEILALANQYKKLEQSGLMDDEKSYKLAMDLTTLLSKKDDSADARADRRNLAMMTQAIHSATAGTTAALNAERLAKMQAEFTPQQKKDYAIIEPSLKAAPKAGDMLMQVEDLKRYNKIAPDGLFSSAFQSTVGAYNNSPEYLAAQNIKRTIAAMIPNTARLPGSASNLDLVKIEEGLGRLTAPNLDRKGRENIINEIDVSVRRVLERTGKIQNYWEEYKKAPPANFYQDNATEIPKPKPKNITQADLEATAKKHNMTVDQVKRQLGIE
jgi:hypothetical protein